MNTIKVGGEERNYRILYRDIFRYEAKLRAVGRLVKAYKERGKEYNLDTFIFWCVWKSLIKKGVWPFRKPFRSMAAMIKRIEADEYEGMCNLVSGVVLPKPPAGEEKKNQESQ